ncbi:MAG TPA: ABC transporter permease subunit [Burkholderiaceae bacterium]|nr:ABC transporter permease subunit [Burkholderiaceae bacterium]
MGSFAVRNRWRGAVLPLAAFVLVEVLMRILGVASDGLALPSEVVRALTADFADASIFLATLQTLGCALAGLAIGGGAGFLVGLLLGGSRVAAGIASIPVETLRHMPPVALIPIATLVLGLGARMEMAIVSFTCFWPMLLLTRDAVLGVDGKLLEVARILRLGPLATLRKIVLPAASSRIAVAVRLSAGISLIVAITTEIAANPLGLGYGMVRAQQELQPAHMYGYLAWLAVLGLALNTGLSVLANRMFPDRRSR